jgi:hypothetical protein
MNFSEQNTQAARVAHIKILSEDVKANPELANEPDADGLLAAYTFHYMKHLLAIKHAQGKRGWFKQGAGTAGNLRAGLLRALTAQRWGDVTIYAAMLQMRADAFSEPPAPFRDFVGDIAKFNAMYGMNAEATPQYTTRDELAARLQVFRGLLSDKTPGGELSELDEILDMLAEPEGTETTPSMVDVFVKIADWLNDIIVYCASESLRHGVAISPVLECIMDANFSKLGADGKPIVVNGKVQKGPNYAPPEPAIKKHLTRVLEKAAGTPLAQQPRWR